MGKDERELAALLNNGMKIDTIYCDDGITYGVSLLTQGGNRYWHDIRVPFQKLAQAICYEYHTHQINQWSVPEYV